MASIINQLDTTVVSWVVISGSANNVDHLTAAEFAGIEAAMAQRSVRLIDGAMAEGSFTEEFRRYL